MKVRDTEKKEVNAYSFAKSTFTNVFITCKFIDWRVKWVNGNCGRSEKSFNIKYSLFPFTVLMCLVISENYSVQIEQLCNFTVNPSNAEMSWYLMVSPKNIESSYDVFESPLSTLRMFFCKRIVTANLKMNFILFVLIFLSPSKCGHARLPSLPKIRHIIYTVKISFI